MSEPITASADIDLQAFVTNITSIAAHVAPATVMVVVKADAYGHGMIRCAQAARDAGFEWLGAATLGEARTLRQAGDTGSLFAWIYGDDEDLSGAVADEIELGVHRVEHIAQVAAATAAASTTARVHLKIDTGLSRNGAPMSQWRRLCAAARDAEQAGALEVSGIWSHFACADELGHPANDAQMQVFENALEIADQAGLRPRWRHIANSAGALQLPASHYDMVRVGIAAYGVDPADADVAERAGVRLRPVMTLRAQLTNIKELTAGSSVSYGATWTADAPTMVGLVPLGYADGVPRHASNVAECAINGRWVPIRGRVCMDQFVIDLGPGATDACGDNVILFGGQDAPKAEDWGRRCGTIGYEIVTRIGGRVPRQYNQARPDRALHTQAQQNGAQENQAQQNQAQYAEVRRDGGLSSGEVQ